jgi:hypothetical protein
VSNTVYAILNTNPIILGLISKWVREERPDGSLVAATSPDDLRRQLGLMAEISKQPLDVALLTNTNRGKPDGSHAISVVQELARRGLVGRIGAGILSTIFNRGAHQDIKDLVGANASPEEYSTLTAKIPLELFEPPIVQFLNSVDNLFRVPVTN